MHFFIANMMLCGLWNKDHAWSITEATLFEIGVLQFNTSQDHINENLTLSLAWLQCLKPKWKHLPTTYAVSWHPPCGVVFIKERSRFFCKFSWTWRRECCTYAKPIVSEWKWQKWQSDKSSLPPNYKPRPRCTVVNCNNVVKCNTCRKL